MYYVWNSSSRRSRTWSNTPPLIVCSFAATSSSLQKTTGTSVPRATLAAPEQKERKNERHQTQMKKTARYSCTRWRTKTNQALCSNSNAQAVDTSKQETRASYWCCSGQKRAWCWHQMFFQLVARKRLPCVKELRLSKAKTKPAWYHTRHADQIRTVALQARRSTTRGHHPVVCRTCTCERGAVDEDVGRF